MVDSPRIARALAHAAPVKSEQRKEPIMPMVQVKLIKGVFDQDQKQEMIHKITETMVGIEGEALRPVTWVLVEEVESGDWGIGGQGITAQYVKDLQAGTA
jgi:4-oxalocrotonate tautomerase